MNTAKNLLLTLALLGALLFMSPGARGQEAPSLPADGGNASAKTPQISPPGKTGSLRESEILGTVEKPGLSSRLPWKNPEGVDTGPSRLHRSFLNEIFRPIGPAAGVRQKNDLK
ncbi:MAG: hypothetical protein HY202_09075 [Nitrospirae bacterium]|nr:hypothetical protein [Nitrospirota bacterium]